MLYLSERSSGLVTGGGRKGLQMVVEEDEVDRFLSLKDGKIYRDRDSQLYA